MKNIRNASNNFFRIIDEFLNKSINVILNARINKITISDEMKNYKVLSYF